MDDEKIIHCNLYTGEPYISEKDGKYHVLQGSMTADDVKKWYDTESEAVERWNSRVKAAYGYEQSRMGINRDINIDFETMKSMVHE